MSENSNTEQAYTSELQDPEKWDTITETFGTVSTYNTVLNKIAEVLKPVVAGEDISTDLLLSKKEIKGFVEGMLKADLKDARLIIRNKESRIFRAKESLKVKTLSEEERKVIEDKIKEHQIKIDSWMPTLDSLGKLFASKYTFDKVWKSMYPNNKSGDNSVAREQDYEEDDGIDYLSDFTVGAEERNQQDTVTNSVKDFLSHIYYEGKPIDFGRAYLECLRLLGGLDNSNGNLYQMIEKKAEKKMGVTIIDRTKSAAILMRILSLISTARNSQVGYKDKTVGKYADITLSPNSKFISEGAFLITNNLDVTRKNVREIQEINDEDSLVYRRLIKNGFEEATPDYLKRIAKLSGQPEVVIKAYYKQHQAQETLRNLMSLFTSQREGNYMIALREHTFDGLSMQYINAQHFGASRAVYNSIRDAFVENWSNITVKQWETYRRLRNPAKGETGSAKEALVHILESLGLEFKLNENNGKFGPNTLIAIDRFREEVLLNAGPRGSGKEQQSKNEKDDTDEGPLMYNIEALIDDRATLLRELTTFIVGFDSDARPSKYRSADGKTKYTFHNGSQALDVIERIIEHSSEAHNYKKLFPLPIHLTSAYGKLNGFVSGLNKILRLVDHDATTKKGGNSFVTKYSDENNKTWMERTFSDAFLNYIRINSSGTPTYIQNFYTTSSRPSQLGAEVNVLSPAEVTKGLHLMVEQHLTAPDITSIKNYSKYKSINADQITQAIDAVMSNSKRDMSALRADVLATGNEESRKRLSEAYVEAMNSSDKIVDKIEQLLLEESKKTAADLVKNKVMVGSDVYKVTARLKKNGLLTDKSNGVGVTSLIEQNRDSVGYTAETIEQLMHTFLTNNYVNSFFLNQAVVGNFNFFKNAEDLGKRLSSVFAPGTKGLVGEQFFGKPTFKVAIMDDPKFTIEHISEALKGTPLEAALARKGIDLADAQGFMTPRRKADLTASFGEIAVGDNLVFKAAYYGVVKKEVAIAGQEATQIEDVPVLLKYSSVVLTDELVAKYPILKELRDRMEEGGIDEAIFESGTKVGVPKTKGVVHGSEKFNGKIELSEESTHVLTSDNYRIQLNPKSKDFKEEGVANPTQLGYIINTLNKATGFNDNSKNTKEIYKALGSLIRRGREKFIKESLDADGKISRKEIIESLNENSNERIIELIKAGVPFDMPMLADKVMIQLSNVLTKKTVKVKFPGGKMIFQTSFGIKHKGRNLEYKNENGRIYAEVVLPKIYQNMFRNGDFHLPDLLGFKIPSTSMNSGIALKVVDFYDSKGSNVVIAPAALVLQTGGDFDIDFLFILARAHYPANSFGFTEGEPVGYYLVKGKYEWSPVAIEKAFEDQRKTVSKEELSDLEKIYDQFLLNTIIENLMDVFSNEKNIKRVAEPLSMGVIKNVLTDLGLEKTAQLNLSLPLDNLRFYNSNFQGVKLVGGFVNISKALSYMTNAGVPTEGKNNNYPALTVEPIIIGNQILDRFTESEEKSTNLWQAMSALINAATDNVKEQLLSKLNATNATGRIYGAALALGMDFKSAVVLMNQPVMRRLSDIGGRKSISLVKEEFINRLMSMDAKYISNTSEFDLILKEQITDGSILTIESMAFNISKSVEMLTKEEIFFQLAVLHQIDKLDSISSDIFLFSDVISVIQGFPIEYYKLTELKSKWDNVLTVDQNGTVSTNKNFSFNVDNLFVAQPNIMEGYKTLYTLIEVAQKTFFKHSPQINEFVDNLIKTSGIVVKYNGNSDAVKKELVSYLLSSMYSESVESVKPVSYINHNGIRRDAIGKEAWNECTLTNLYKVLKNNAAEGSKNKFLNKLSITSKYGLRRLNFSVSGNLNSSDEIDLRIGFENIDDEQVKRSLVQYAVLNFGMTFSTMNYSAYIPADYLGELSDYLSELNQMIVGKKNHWYFFSNGVLNNIGDHFMVCLAAKVGKGLPYIGKNSLSIQSLNEKNELKFVMKETSTKTLNIKVLSGVTERRQFYNRKYSVVVENDKHNMIDGVKYKQFPMFTQRSDPAGRTVIYLNVSEEKSDYVLYQRIGFINLTDGYYLSKQILKNGYRLESYFGRGIIPVLKQSEGNSLLQIQLRSEDRIIVYTYGNWTRENGIIINYSL